MARQNQPLVATRMRESHPNRQPPQLLASKLVWVRLVSCGQCHVFHSCSITPPAARAVTKNYYRGAVGGLLVYDITSRETYNQLQHWLTDARTLAVDNCAIVVVGNKADLKDQREVTSFSGVCQAVRDLGPQSVPRLLADALRCVQVTHVEACRFAQENDLIFLETSALSGEGVDEAFMNCARKILAGIENGSVHVEGAQKSTGTQGSASMGDAEGEAGTKSGCRC